MYRTTVRPDGSVQLGEAARAAGYAAGQTIDVILTRSGSLILALADDSEAIEIDVTRLPPGRARAALVEGKRR